MKGKAVDTITGEETPILEEPLLAEEAEKLAMLHGRVVEILGQCPICEGFFRPTEVVDTQFCSVACAE